MAFKIFTHKAQFAGNLNFPLRGFFYNQQDIKPHLQEFTEIVFILEGESGHFTAPAGWSDISGGDVWIIPPNGIHGYRKAKHLKIFNLLFAADRLPMPLLDLYAHRGYKKLFIHDAADYYPHLKLTGKQLDEFRSLLENFVSFQKTKSPGRNSGKYGIFMAIISKLCDIALEDKHTPAEEMPFDIARITRFLNENYASDIGIPELKNITAMSESTLRRHFQKAFGMTPVKYIRMFRAEIAARLLLTSTLSVKEIAHLTGFNGINYFSRTFHEFYRMPPGEYRKSGKL